MASNVGPTEAHEFYGDGANAAAVATDLSGNANCTAGAGEWIYQSAFSPGEPCTVMVSADCNIGTDPAGYLFARYSGTTRMGIRSNGNGNLQFILSNVVSQTIGIPRGVGVYEVIVHWAMMDDPLNAGQSRSQVRVWDGTNTTFLDGVDWTHTTPSVAGTDLIWGAQVVGGTNTTGATLLGAGYLLHATSPLNVLRDRVTAAAAPTLTGDATIELPVPDFASGIGDQGRLAGPTHYTAAGALDADRLLMVSPLVNKQWEDADSINFTALGASPWFALSPDGTSALGIPFLFRRPVPSTVDQVKVRVFIAGGSSLGSNVTVDVTAWSFSRNPVVAGDPLVSDSDTQSFGPVNDTTSGNAGRWLEFDPITIAREDNEGFSWFGVSIEFTAGGGPNSDFTVRSITVEALRT